jgi:hypothetical protein
VRVRVIASVEGTEKEEYLSTLEVATFEERKKGEPCEMEVTVERRKMNTMRICTSPHMKARELPLML